MSLNPSYAQYEIPNAPKSVSVASSYRKRAFCDKSVSKDDDVKKFASLSISTSVQNIPEMISSLMADSKKYNFIVICGHGSPGAQGLGSNTSSQYQAGKDFDIEHIDDCKPYFDQIHGALNTSTKPFPILFLAGCEVGADSRLIRKISKIMKNVLVIASVDALTYKLDSRQGIEIYKLVKGKAHPSPIEFQFALNERMISFSSLEAKTGHDPSSLEQELLHFDN
jgi:hypothetical protein